MTYFKIPTVLWKERYSKSQNNVLLSKSWETTNTFIPYTAHYIEESFRCYYGEGRYKEFTTLEQLQDWVQNTHYPAQIAKYMERVHV